MTPSVRRVRSTVALVTLFLLAGCLSGTGPPPGASGPTSAGPTAVDGTPTATTLSGHPSPTTTDPGTTTPADWHGPTTHPNGTLQLSGAADLHEATQYYPENDTVRYPFALGSEGVVEYGTDPFESYATYHCRWVAEREFEAWLEARYGGVPERVSVNVRSNVTVTYTGTNESVVHRLQRRYPDRLRIRVSLFNRTHSCTHPLVVEYVPP